MEMEFKDDWDGNKDLEMIWLISGGRKLLHTKSESAASLKTVETRDDLQASPGDVREMMWEMHSTGSMLQFFIEITDRFYR